MKKTSKSKILPGVEEDMRQEYDFDYRLAKPNRFASQQEEDRVTVMLDPDVAKVFRTSDTVNKVLRALIETMPPKAKRKKASA